MNRRIVLGIGFAMLLAVTSFAGAEEGKPDRKGPPGPLPPGIEKLDLSKDQREQIRTILKDAREQFEEARKNKDREAAMKIHEEVHAKIMDVLTEEQREQLKKMREAHEGDRPKKGPPPREGDGEGKAPPPGKRPPGGKGGGR